MQSLSMQDCCKVEQGFISEGVVTIEQSKVKHVKAFFVGVYVRFMLLWSSDQQI